MCGGGHAVGVVCGGVHVVGGMVVVVLVLMVVEVMVGRQEYLRKMDGRHSRREKQEKREAGERSFSTCDNKHSRCAQHYSGFHIH